MNLSSPYFIGIDALNLAFFKERPRHDQGVMLLNPNTQFPMRRWPSCCAAH